MDNLWQGFHHIALVTPNLDETIRFYRDVLGMQAGEVMERQGRHCFVQPGGDTWGVHFFEYADAAIATHLDLLSNRFLFLAGALQHIAFALPDEESALTLRERLKAHGVDMTNINEIASICNFLFVDNNGILLEATWPNPRHVLSGE